MNMDRILLADDEIQWCNAIKNKDVNKTKSLRTENVLRDFVV